MKKILMLSVGRQTYLVDLFSRYFQVEIGDNSHLTLDMYEGVKKYLMPRYDSDEYASKLRKIVSEEGIDYLLSLSDIEIALVSELKPTLPSSCELLMPNKVISYQCLDKYAFSKLLIQNGIGSPHTFLTPREVKDAIKKGHLSLPIIGKSRWGMGSKGVTFIDDEEELELFYKLYKNKFKAPLFLGSEMERVEESLVFQEVINGEEYGLDIVNDLSGNWFKTAIKKKLMMRGGETDSAEITINSDILSVSQKISKVLKHKGNVDCDILVNSRGIFVIDINPRFGGGYMFSLSAGLDVPYYLSCWAEEKIIPVDKMQLNTQGRYRKITELKALSSNDNK